MTAWLGWRGWAVVGVLVFDTIVVLVLPVSRVSASLSNIVLTASALVSALVCLQAARRGPHRRAWRLMSAALLAWAGGNLLWTYDLAALGQAPPSASVADLFYIAFYPLAVAALVVLPGAPTCTIGRLRTILDGMIAAATLVVLLWQPLLAPLLGRAQSPLGHAVSLAYMVGDVALLAVLVSLAAHSTVRGRRTGSLLIAGFVLVTIADTAYAVGVHGDGYVSGSPVILGWTFGFALLGLAANQRPDTADAAGTSEAAVRAVSPRRWRVHVPLLLVAPALVLAAATVSGQGVLPAGVALPGLIGVVLMLGRQTLAVRENVELNHRLEQLVAAKTASLTQLAYEDPLTGLPNRRRLIEELAATSPSANGFQRWLGLGDVDGFKQLNDTLGHLAGDEALRHIAHQLHRARGAGDLVFRLGGDEFAVLFHASGPDQALLIATRLCDALQEETLVQGRRLRLHASLGIAPVLAGPDQALRHADLAMYAAKQAGGAQVKLFDRALTDQALQRMDLENDLRRAIACDELGVVYQPIVELATGAVVGAEALSRWVHPDRGSVSPEVFIRLAEESELISVLGANVLATACRAARDWGEHGGQPVPVWVNLSPRQLEHPDFVVDVLRLLEHQQLDPHALVLEVTEGLFLDPGGTTAAGLARLRAAGVRIAIDDFGTGYSSLARLHQLPADILKLDREFVAALARDTMVQPAITRAIIAMAASLGLMLVAEGVETEEERSLLLREGAHFGQGFGLCRPQSGEAIRELVRPRRQPTREPAWLPGR